MALKESNQTKKTRMSQSISNLHVKSLLQWQEINKYVSCTGFIFKCPASVDRLSNSYTLVISHVRGDNPHARVDYLHVQADKPGYNYFIPPAEVLTKHIT